MSSHEYNTLRAAIANRQQVTAMFKSVPRKFCPHAIGTKNGKPHVFVYQFGGESSSRPLETEGSPKNWRCMPVDGLYNITLQNGAWHTATSGGHSKPQSYIDQINLEVSY